MSWRPEFFIWLRHQMIVVEDWPYAGTDFTGDPDLPLPDGEDWDEELGKNSIFFDVIYICDFVNTCLFSNSVYMCIQMLARSGQLTCLIMCAERNPQQTLR